MSLVDHIFSVTLLVLSLSWISYMFFMLLIVPILPLDDTNILHSFSPAPVLLFSGIFGLIFIGVLSIFTLVVMNDGKWIKGGMKSRK